MGMYIFRRLLGLIPMLFLITVAVFLMMHAAPGNAFDAILNPGIKDMAALQQRLIESAGLNKPLWWQYVHWLTQFVQGNWGYSFTQHQLVICLIGPALENTLLLAVMAEMMTLSMGIPVGILQARNPYGKFDYGVSIISFVLFSVPYFILAIFLIYFFAIDLKIFPAQGAMGTGPGAGSFLDHVYHAFLPALAMALVGTTVYSRYTRGTMLDVRHEDYVRTAFAKGLSGSLVFRKHVLRNAMIPIVTQFGYDIGGMVGGTVILEGLFSYQGMGLLTINAVNDRDYPVLMATSLLFAVGVLFGNLVADILYAVVDPRIRYN